MVFDEFRRKHPTLFWVIVAVVALTLVALVVLLILFLTGKIGKKKNSKEHFVVLDAESEDDYVNSVIDSIYGNGKGIISGTEVFSSV